MIQRKIRRAIQASRAPNPVRTIAADVLPQRTPSVAIGIGRTIESTLALLNVNFGPRTLLIPDPRANGTPGPRLAYSVASFLANAGDVSIGMPIDLSMTDSRRWKSLATSAGARVLVLGSSGWERIEFGDRSLILEYGDFPAELRAATTVVALSTPSDSGCIPLWTEIVHPNTSLRARASGSAVFELSMAVDAQYVVCGQVGAWWLIALAEPAIAAELIARGFERLRQRLKGIESIGPWEDAGVQHLSSLGEAGTTTVDLVLDARLEDNAGNGIARQLAEMLGWQLRFSDDHVGGAK
ncbi:MAG TPA: hypothetical protein VEX37_01090 [Thermomicrobiales bacterium]|nr:hypothetical protein [Thermomicrobiales bacterium]